MNERTNLQTQDINGANKNFKANLSRKNPKISKKKGWEREQARSRGKGNNNNIDVNEYNGGSNKTTVSQQNVKLQLP